MCSKKVTLPLLRQKEAALTLIGTVGGLLWVSWHGELKVVHPDVLMILH